VSGRAGGRAGDRIAIEWGGIDWHNRLVVFRPSRAAVDGVSAGGVAEDPRRHDLRHSFGSQLAMANVPVRQIQHWMGHSTIAVTMRYMHLAPGGGREFSDALEADDPANRITRSPGLLVITGKKRCDPSGIRNCCEASGKNQVWRGLRPHLPNSLVGFAPLGSCRLAPGRWG
jgi:hypothetical protein